MAEEMVAQSIVAAHRDLNQIAKFSIAVVFIRLSFTLCALLYALCLQNGVLQDVQATHH